ncbi:unnamed protein product [Bursaphelenchus xylophilus]|uniref:(pine wood nematode) hypothetical protein n=1 Tax=Bursaphelenchus xylophilus TaxID=6326 RepID=A0A1I7SG81_BURXY|nr:unnamed protein product [Bursaphelenchus xylophilus]CAG9092246.1 unnamed protein product [Bursaphelenchus xylophilus]
MPRSCSLHFLMKTAEGTFVTVRYVELFAWIVTLALSVYFNRKIWKVPTISRNLRIIIMVSTAFCLYISLIHVLFNFIPAKYYNCVHKDYRWTAVALNGLMLIAHIQIIMVEFKYVLIALERLYAYRLKGRYDEYCNCFIVRAYLKCFLGSMIIFILRVVFIIYMNPEMHSDELIVWTIHMDSSVWGLFFMFVISSMAMMFSVVIFFYLHVRIRKDEGNSYCLRLRYEIKQTKHVLRYIISLVGLAFLLLFVCVLYYVGMFYYMFHDGLTDYSYQIRSIKTVLMTSLSVYNFACMAFMIRGFPQLQKAIYRDFAFLEKRISEPQMSRVAPGMESDMYFKQLHNSWL